MQSWFRASVFLEKTVSKPHTQNRKKKKNYIEMPLTGEQFFKKAQCPQKKIITNWSCQNRTCLSNLYKLIDDQYSSIECFELLHCFTKFWMTACCNQLDLTTETWVLKEIALFIEELNRCLNGGTSHLSSFSLYSCKAEL